SGPGAEAARAYPGGPCAAARRHRQAPYGSSPTRGDEPARSDRADDDERGRPRVPERHPRATQEFARPLQFRERGSGTADKLAHDPEKCAAVFRQDHAQTTGLGYSTQIEPLDDVVGLEFVDRAGGHRDLAVHDDIATVGNA